MMHYTVELGRIVDIFQLEKLNYTDEHGKIKITESDVNRPGLPLTGFFEYFDNRRIQVLGKVEWTYLSTLTPEQRYAQMEKLLSKRMPALICTRSDELTVWPGLLELARKYDVALLRTKEHTSRFIAGLVLFLNAELAERMTCHGVLVEVYGEGVLLTGESGVGKSETAIELVKRGHRLVADDAVEIKRLDDRTLVGTAPEIIRHFIELRGVGIVDVKNIFGLGAVKDSTTIDFVVNMEIWDDAKNYERLGLDDKFTSILGVDVPSMLVPVRPGRNLAVIIEVASMNNRQKRMGYNAAQELSDRQTRAFSADKADN